MIDAVYILLIEDLEQGFVQLARRDEIMSERLFDDDARPPFFILCQTSRAEAKHNLFKHRGGSGHVKKMVGTGAGALQLIECFLNSDEGLFVRGVCL